MGEVNRSIKNKKLVQRAGLPRRVKDMSKEQLEAALFKKKECNARALLIVERLLENTVTEEWFLESLRFISDTHFQDIIEERVILMLCGYPLCHQNLKNIPTQQYRISTKLNKVYDISERKNFCSNQCYKASKYIKDQLLTSPLWLRDKEEIPVFKVLPLGSSGTGAGEEVDFGQNNSELKEEIAQLKKDEDFTSIAKFAQDSLSALSKTIDKLENKEREKVFEEDLQNPLDDQKGKSNKKDTKHVKFEDESSNSDIKIDPQRTLETPLGQKQQSAENGLLNSVVCSDNTTTDTKKNVESKDEQILQSVENILLNSDVCSHNITPEIKKNVESKEESTISVSESVTETVVEEKVETTNLEKVSETVPEKKLNADINVNKNDNLVCKSVEQHGSKTVADKTSLPGEKTKEQTSETEKKVKVKEKRHSKSQSKSKSKKKEVDVPQVTNSVIHIETCLHEWFTIDSMCFLFGEEKVKEMVVDKGECINEYYKIVGSTTRDAAMREKYEAICRRLNLIELEENKFDAEAREMKPLPDYTMLKEESKTMQIKVRAFFQGNTNFEIPTEIQPDPDNDDGRSTILPLVDLHAQNALRRRIVLDRLNRILPDLLRTFDLSSRDVTTDVRALFCTFTLGSHNITFKPAEWSLLGLVIIKMLSIRDVRLKMILDTEQAAKYQTMMLMAFNQDGGYLERLMAWLTDIDNILQKQPLTKSSRHFSSS